MHYWRPNLTWIKSEEFALVWENRGFVCMIGFMTAYALYRVPTPPAKSWIFFFKIPGPGKSWEITLVLESPRNWSLRSWKVLGKYSWKLRVSEISRISSTKFGQLILSRIVKIVATRCHTLRLKCTKFNFGRVSAPDPTLRELTALPRSPSWI